MKTLILMSDSHGDFDTLVEIVESNRQAAAYLHAGDGYKELKMLQKLYPDKEIHGVTGNCDWESEGDSTFLYTVSTPEKEYRLLLTHGHLFNAKRTLNRLAEEGLSQQVDGVIYGHTHRGDVRRLGGVTLINPGSCFRRWGGAASYARLHLGDYMQVEFVDI